MPKAYCYVDETGQDTGGRLFIVAIIVLAKDRDDRLMRCERAEAESGKGKAKWGRARSAQRLDYMRRIIEDAAFRGCLCYAVSLETTLYDVATTQAIINAVQQQPSLKSHQMTVYVDGLSKTKRHWYARRLHQAGLVLDKVRGINRDENDALIRLADAVAGFVRDALYDGPSDALSLFRRGQESAALVEV